MKHEKKKQKEEQKREKLHTEALKVCKAYPHTLPRQASRLQSRKPKQGKKNVLKRPKRRKKGSQKRQSKRNRLAAEAKRLAAQKPKKAKQKKRPLKKRTRLDLEKLWEREAKRPKRARVAPDYKCKGCTGLWLTWEDNQFSEELGPWQNCETCDFSMCGVCCKAGLLEKHESEHTQ